MNREDWIDRLHEFAADVHDGAYAGETDVFYKLTPGECMELVALLEVGK